MDSTPRHGNSKAPELAPGAFFFLSTVDEERPGSKTPPTLPEGFSPVKIGQKIIYGRT